MKHFNLEPEPKYAKNFFKENIYQIRKFVTNLCNYGEKLGLLGPREYERIWSRHIINCAIVSNFLEGQKVADIGSGAGLPGIVLAIMNPDIEFDLIEPMEKRAKWLLFQVENIGIKNVKVINSRAQDISKKNIYNSVTARAVSSLDKLIPLSVPLLKPKGKLVFLKGKKVNEEIFNAKQVFLKHAIIDYKINNIKINSELEETKVFTAYI